MKSIRYYFSCIFVLYNSAFKELHFPPKNTHKARLSGERDRNVLNFFILRQYIGRQADSIRLYQPNSDNCLRFSSIHRHFFSLSAFLHLSGLAKCKSFFQCPQSTKVFNRNPIDKCCNNFINTHNRRNKKVNNKNKLACLEIFWC